MQFKFIIKSLHIFFTISLLPCVSQATDIIEVKPLTAKILMIHFDDGYATHHKRGQARGNESVTILPLNVVKAMVLSSYTIQSADDANYSILMNPVDIGRKSKPTEFGLMCQAYSDGCINTDPDHALEHWVYLVLPTELQSGKTYTLTLDALAASGNTINFTFDEKVLHSEVIHVNNIGYSTAAPAKYAYLYHWMGDKGGLDLSSFNAKPFKILNTETNTFVFTGTIAFRKSKTNVETGQSAETPGGNFAAADVYECDFSAFNTPGNYKVVVEGIGCSFPFVIGEDAYHEAFYWTMKGLYQSRSGIPLTAPYSQFERPAPHNVMITPGFSGRLKYSTFRTADLSHYDGAPADKGLIEAGYKGTLSNTFGWYQDAGDWDGYYTHSNIPSFLLFLYESGPEKFTDGELDIPESGNGMPDVLDEAAWLLRYFKRAKDEIKQKGWGTGGVPGARVFGDLWGSDTKPDDVGQGSWEDIGRDWYLLGEDPWTSYKYAAAAAQLAYILESNSLSDPEGVNWRQEAIDAYAWAKANTKSGDEVKNDPVSEPRLYAAASLFRLTGENQYHNTFVKEIKNVASLNPDKKDQMFGLWMYLLSWNQTRETHALASAKQLVTTGTEKYLVLSAETRAARWGGDFYFPMLVGQGSTPMVAPGVFGYLLNKNNAILGNKYLKYLHTTADYFLGCNPLNLTWISGVGERYPEGLFHLDWWYYDKADANNKIPVLKGVVPYGPWRYDTSLGVLGWWNPNWAYSDKAGNPRVYPAGALNWPGHERWFDMRVSPLSSEFTIHQNTIISAFIYGFLTAGASTNFQEGVITANESELKKESVNFSVTPNPTNDSIAIQSLKRQLIGRVELLTIDGKTVKRMDFPERTSGTVLDVTDVNAGKYIVKIYSSSRVAQTTKVVILK